jgi:hypothetical protein
MWTQKTESKDGSASTNRFYGDETNGVAVSDGGDFSPAFWLASAPAQGGRPPRIPRRQPMIAGVPLGYPLLVGIFLIFAFLFQRSFALM